MTDSFVTSSRRELVLVAYVACSGRGFVGDRRYDDSPQSSDKALTVP
jgi:hypothetical protein